MHKAHGTFHAPRLKSAGGGDDVRSSHVVGSGRVQVHFVLPRAHAPNEVKGTAKLAHVEGEVRITHACHAVRGA